MSVKRRNEVFNSKYIATMTQDDFVAQYSKHSAFDDVADPVKKTEAIIDIYNKCVADAKVAVKSGALK